MLPYVALSVLLYTVLPQCLLRLSLCNARLTAFPVVCHMQSHTLVAGPLNLGVFEASDDTPSSTRNRSFTASLLQQTQEMPLAEQVHDGDEPLTNWINASVSSRTQNRTIVCQFHA